MKLFLLTFLFGMFIFCNARVSVFFDSTFDEMLKMAPQNHLEEARPVKLQNATPSQTLERGSLPPPNSLPAGYGAEITHP